MPAALNFENVAIARRFSSTDFSRMVFAWQVIEFESTALMIGHLGVRVSLIAYPVVSIKKALSPSSSWLHGLICL